MKFIYSKTLKYSTLLFLSFFLLSCHSKTEKVEHIQSITVQNGKSLEIKKTDRNTTSIGIITSHNYGTTHQYSYEMTLDGDIYWYGGSHEPKQILFHNEQVYLKFLYQKRYNTSTLDTLINETKTSHYYKTEEDYQKHIDERYFFNWFGKDYWLNIDSMEYHSLQKVGQEFEVPNDGELILEQ